MFYEKLINKFENVKNSMFGVSLENVSNYLKKMLIHINEEKDYYEQNKNEFLRLEQDYKKQNKKFSKYIFYKEMDSRTSDLKNKTNRNKLFHDLEYSLAVLNK